MLLDAVETFSGKHQRLNLDFTPSTKFEETCQRKLVELSYAASALAGLNSASDKLTILLISTMRFATKFGGRLHKLQVTKAHLGFGY